MLASIMNPDNWDRAPRNTNEVERVNSSTKSGGQNRGVTSVRQRRPLPPRFFGPYE